MRGAKRSAKNTAKNISLLVLCGLMGVLCAVNWLMGLNIAQMPADSALRRLHDRFVGGAVGYEIRSSGVSAADRHRWRLQPLTASCTACSTI